MTLSVAIITRNEAERLPDCVRSATFADEVLVVDSDSSDNTPAIARNLGCRVLSEPWRGFAEQKQFAVERCRHDQVLILDADERIPPETAAGIREICRGERMAFGAYSFLRKNFFHDRWIRHCGWWPDRIVRLVDRRQGRFSDHLVHEHWICQGKVKALDLCIEHYSFRNYSDIIHKMEIYSTLNAREMQRKGKRPGWWSPPAHGFWMFVRTYFFKLGILDGFDGFMIAALNAGGSFLKYAKCREMNLEQESKLCHQ